jgi:hypothetical protein
MLETLLANGYKVEFQVIVTQKLDFRTLFVT